MSDVRQNPPGPPEDELQIRALALQLYLADHYNMTAVDTATVLIYALADTIAYNLRPGHTVDTLVDNFVETLKTNAQFRVDNPPALGLAEIVREYRRTGGKDHGPS